MKWGRGKKAVLVLEDGSGLIIIGHVAHCSLGSADGGKRWGRRADVGQPTHGRFRLWQPGFYDFNVYTEEKLKEKLKYIHGNPVKAGLVVSPRDYKWSSHREYFEAETRLSSKF